MFKHDESDLFVQFFHNRDLLSKIALKIEIFLSSNLQDLEIISNFVCLFALQFSHLDENYWKSYVVISVFIYNFNTYKLGKKLNVLEDCIFKSEWWLQRSFTYWIRIWQILHFQLSEIFRIATLHWKYVSSCIYLFVSEQTNGLIFSIPFPRLLTN